MDFTWIHGSTPRHNDVWVQVLPNIHITLHDGIVGCLVDPSGFHTDEGRLEEGLRTSESLVVHRYHLPGREMIFNGREYLNFYKRILV